MILDIVQRKCGLGSPRQQLLEGDVALMCACGNRDSAPSFWFRARVFVQIECSAECGRFMRFDDGRPAIDDDDCDASNL